MASSTVIRGVSKHHHSVPHELAVVLEKQNIVLGQESLVQHVVVSEPWRAIFVHIFVELAHKCMFWIRGVVEG